MTRSKSYASKKILNEEKDGARIVNKPNLRDYDNQRDLIITIYRTNE